MGRDNADVTLDSQEQGLDSIAEHDDSGVCGCHAAMSQSQRGRGEARNWKKGRGEGKGQWQGANDQA